MPSARVTRTTVLSSIATVSTIELAELLLKEFDELTNRFHLGDFRPSELSGGRFSEAAFRLCEQVCLGSHTPLGRQLPRVDQLLSRLEAGLPGSDDTFRIHIPRALRLIYDLRNKRDVAHLGVGSVSPSFTDASLVVGVAGWVVSEVVRVSHDCDIDTAQAIVDGLVQRRAPLVWQEDDIVRVLNPSLAYRDQVLLILYHLHPEWVEEKHLFEWVEYSRLADFRKNVLATLHRERLIEYRDGRAKLLPTGLLRVEESFRGSGTET